nr:chemotaxis protein CheA [uncultured Rhodoferax sp.]
MSKTDADFIAQALPAFMSEAAEQIDLIESLLLQLEESPQDKELLDALFRCAHTVKGSAGIFGLGKVVGFTHHVESLLDKMRDAKVVCSPAINTLLLQCNDQIKHLVQTASNDAADTVVEGLLREQLIAQLEHYGASSVAPANAPQAHVPVPSPPAGDGQADWRITARFGPDTFRSGLDPLSLLRYLMGLGAVRSIEPLIDSVPNLKQINPEDCHLGFVLLLRTNASRELLTDAFSFVEEDCQYALESVPTPESVLVKAIENMPEVPRLGDILVNAGAVDSQTISMLLKEQGADAGKPRLGELLTREGNVAPEVVNAALGKQQKIRENSNPATEDRYIRVQADRLDTVINLLGELAIASAGSILLARNSRQVALLESNLSMSSLIDEIRNGTLGLRMVPIGETFSRFRRVVRDTASQLGKEVVFEIFGGDAELDKSMVEKIADPLMHLVRNSLDHGLETPEERVAAGKPVEGRLVLRARHETGAILIQIQDDGRGINREKVLQRAWDRGLVERGVVPGDDEINMLIFEPGFSTAEKVTDLSGRGVGMDVVRRNIEALRGTLKLVSSSDKGLRVDIRLPLTLAIIDGFLVGVGKSKFVLPLESVVEVIEAADASVKADPSGRHCVELRGAVLPVVRLRSLYDIESGNVSRTSVVVVHSPKGKYGVEVETLLGQNQIVIKSLGRLFKTLRGISGSSVLGSGEVALILDVVSLGELSSTASITSNISM